MPCSKEAGTSQHPPHQDLGLELVAATLKEEGMDGAPEDCREEGGGGGLMPAAMGTSLGLRRSLILKSHSLIRDSARAMVPEEQRP